MSDSTFKTVEATLSVMPIVNEAALREAHLPDSEVGIIGNSSVGVRDPKSQVKAENVDGAVKSDAKIAKQASVVPQVATTQTQNMQLSNLFTTTAKALQDKGVDLGKLRQPRYRM